MNKINYDKEMEAIIKQNAVLFPDKKPTLLLHSCCAPCSSACIEKLLNNFNITVFYYNPNISKEEEYKKRLAEEQRFLKEYCEKNSVSPIPVVDLDYNNNDFFEKVKGYEDCKEGFERCFICYRLRLEKAAQYAKQNDFDYFCTTLTVSPLKNSQKLNEIGLDIMEKLNIKYLPSDFKKHEGYKRSILLSSQYNLYRQNYCGCIFSQKNN